MIPLSDRVREAFWDIFFPSRCLGCEETLQYSKKEIFCPLCQIDLVVSDTHLNPHHPLKFRLQTNFPFRLVLGKYRFPNHSRLITQMIYGLKYQNLKYIGIEEGKEYGSIIGSLLRKEGINVLLPVPLHYYKHIKRGYNQSLEIARGLSQSTGIPICNSLVRRTKNTRSQTRLNKAERRQNMKNAFRVRNKTASIYTEQPHHYLIIDDVITSGTTLVEIARTLRDSFPDSRYSVCALAYKDY